MFSCKEYTLHSRVSHFTNFLLLVMILGSYLLNFLLFLGIPVNLNYIQYGFTITLYAFVAIISWWKVDQIKQYHFDRTTYASFIFLGVYRTRLEIPNEGYFKAVILILTLMILAACIKSWRKIPKTNWRWAGIAIFACFMIFPISYLESFQPDQYSQMNINPDGLGLTLIQRILTQLSFVTVFEEILFRGILWAYLLRLGWDENKVFWVQALSFWSVHLWRIGTPISFFFTIPIGGLVFSLLTRYSKQLFPSILLHTFSNVLTPFLVYFILH